MKTIFKRSIVFTIALVISLTSVPLYSFADDEGGGQADTGQTASNEMITVDDVPVVYADGKAVEDGHMFDLLIPDSSESTTYTVTDGKLKGMKLKPDSEYRMQISWDDPDENFSFDYIIVTGGEASFKIAVAGGTTRLMYFDAKENKVSDRPVRKIVLKKSDEEDPAEEPGEEPEDPTGNPDEGQQEPPAAEKERVKPGETVNLADLEVVYEDGTPAEDGMRIDLWDMERLFSNPRPAKYTVNGGKVSGIKMRSDAQYKIGFDTTNEFWKTHEVVGAPDSLKLLRIYARYQNELPLYYDYDEGIDAPEQTVQKLIIKKLPEGTGAVQTRPTSCIMNLLVSDGGYAAEGGLPFKLTRRDTGKTKTVYSEEGELTLIANANIKYELTLGENPTYKLDKPILFSCLLDREGKYQAVIDGYDVEDENGRLPCKPIELTRIDGNPPHGSEIGEDDIDPNTYEHIYRSGKVTLQNMKVVENTDNDGEKPVAREVRFVFYNATTQTIESTVSSKDGVLPDVDMVKGQNYIVFAEDKEYQMKNSYIKLNKTGGLPTSYKTNKQEDGFYLTKRNSAISEDDINRVRVELPTYYMNEKNEMVNVPNIHVRFVSPRDTFEAKSNGSGILKAKLLEDTNYMVIVEDKEYSVESFPLAIKDKSEYGSGKFAFNHFTCGNMVGIPLVKKGTEHKRDTVIKTKDGKTTLTGLNFRGGDYHLNARVLDRKIAELEGEDYEVVDIDTINMYRTEVSKLAKGDFTVTRAVPAGKDVAAVYYIDDAGELKKVSFSQSGRTLTFKMDTMAMYDNVIVYKEAKQSISSKDTKVTLNTARCTYNGKAKKPGVKVVVTNGGKKQTLKNGRDYTVAYSANKNIGTAKAVVSGRGKYTGKVTKTFLIVPAGSAIKKLSGAKNAVNVKWTGRTKQITGYQIQYSTSRKFTKAATKTVTVKNYKTTSKKLGKLKGNRKYAVRVRTYKSVKGKNYYSNWSKAKTVKTV